FKPEVLQRFYKQWYRPDLMAVIVVGDIDPAEAEKKIEAHFGGFKNPANEKVRPAITPIQVRTKPEAMVLTDAEATNTILQVFNFIRPAKKVKTWADYKEDLINDMMTSLINQRLQELTKKENPPFVYGFTGLEGFIRGYETFVSGAVLGNNSTKEAVDALIAETERARQFGFLPGEIERVKATMLNEAQRAFNEKDKSESGRLVQSYLSNFLEGTPIPGVANRYEFIKQVLPTITAKDINAVAKQMPANDRSFALLMAPASKKDQLPSEADLLGELVAAAKQPVKAYEEKAVAANLMDAQSLTTGKVTKETKNEKLGITDLSLSNGVTVTLKPTNFKNDQILMDAWRQGGFQRFPLREKDQVKHAAEVVAEMGVKDLSPTDLEKFLSGKTVEVHPYLNDHEEGIEGNSSVKDFETFLQLVNLYFTQPRKDEGLFRSFVTKQKGVIPFLKDNPQYFYQDTLAKIIYGSNPWISVLPTEAEYNQLNADSALALYKQIFGNADGMHFTFVGNVDPEKAKPLLEKYLGSLPGSTAEHAAKDNQVRPVKGVVEANIKRGKESQSYISVVFSGETTFSREENIAFRGLLDVLNIKVIEKLREEMGGIYGGGFSGSIDKRPYTHYTIQASLPCGPENVDKLTAALFDLIRNTQTKGIDQKDLDKVKETWKKQYRTSIQSNDFWLSSLSQAFINQTNPENVLDYEQRVDALTTADIQKAAQKFLKMDNYVKVVLYPENAKVPETKKAF
ncbi:MAG TPA: insulinase family protein, partial [Flavisolibacter sp.]|nr:insulinase family protein [Flavisolibacter sp.]